MKRLQLGPGGLGHWLKMGTAWRFKLLRPFKKGVTVIVGRMGAEGPPDARKS